jgi:hypothetical protein
MTKLARPTTYAYVSEDSPPDSPPDYSGTYSYRFCKKVLPRAIARANEHSSREPLRAEDILITAVIVQAPYVCVHGYISSYPPRPFAGFSKANPSDPFILPRGITIATFRAMRSALGLKANPAYHGTIMAAV